eukprot:Amastigsp_a339872_160.p3 type:complete len:101 gc:universal Amastigsp_a339872_160:258-560(+)
MFPRVWPCTRLVMASPHETLWLRGQEEGQSRSRFQISKILVDSISAATVVVHTSSRLTQRSESRRCASCRSGLTRRQQDISDHWNRRWRIEFLAFLCQAS